MDLNRATIIGRLTRDPELRTTPQGQNVTTVGIATNRTWKDQQGMKQEQVEFHNIVAWGKLAEIMAQYLKKGRQVFIEGRLQSREWQAQDGTKKNRTEIVAENMIMLGDKGNSGGGSNEYAQPEPKGNDGAQDEPTVEDIPF